MCGAEQVGERDPEPARLQVPERLVDGRDRTGGDSGPAGVAHGGVHREPRGAHVLLHAVGERRAHELGGRAVAVRVADARLAAVVGAHDDDRGRVPAERPIRRRRVGRDRRRVDLEPHRVRNSASFPRNDFSITPARSGSPLAIACAIFFACSKVMCGGSGGTSGSVFTSSTTGRSAASASSQAPCIASPLSQKMPFRPTSSAYFAYSNSGSHCVPGNFGSPSMTRCSQVTWFKSWLLKTQKTRRLSRHRSI